MNAPEDLAASSRLASIAWIVLSCFLGVAGQTLAKFGLAKLELGSTPRLGDVGKMLGSPLVWAGGLSLVVGTLVWFYALPKIEFSIAMPVSSLLMLVFSIVAALVCFRESIPPMRAAGLGLAVVSIWLISRGR